MNSGIHTIVDGDTIPWIVAYNHRNKDDTVAAIKNVDEFVESLLNNTHCTNYVGFLGGSKCHRYDIAKHKPYKGQRPTPPDWYLKWGTVMKAHLRDEWKFQVVNGIEADDAVCIAADELRAKDINFVLCHGDKDIYQVEGNHYNLRTHKRLYVDKITGYRNLYQQMLIGDVTDNIEGCKGIGPKTANNLLQLIDDTVEMSKVVEQCFINKYGETKGKELFLETFNLCALLTFSSELNIDYKEYKKKEERNSITLDDLKDIWG